MNNIQETQEFNLNILMNNTDNNKQQENNNIDPFVAIMGSKHNIDEIMKDIDMFNHDMSVNIHKDIPRTIKENKDEIAQILVATNILRNKDIYISGWTFIVEYLYHKYNKHTNNTFNAFQHLIDQEFLLEHARLMEVSNAFKLLAIKQLQYHKDDLLFNMHYPWISTLFVQFEPIRDFIFTEYIKHGYKVLSLACLTIAYLIKEDLRTLDPEAQLGVIQNIGSNPKLAQFESTYSKYQLSQSTYELCKKQGQ